MRAASICQTGSALRIWAELIGGAGSRGFGEIADGVQGKGAFHAIAIGEGYRGGAGGDRLSRDGEGA